MTIAPQSRTFTYQAGNRGLFAAESGAGWPVVMLHGGMADHRALRVSFPTPPAQTRWITPDIRGCGRSVDPGPLSWPQLADDVAILLDHLELERAVVGGVSGGVSVAVEFALRHPDRLAGAAFIFPVHAGGELTPALAGAYRAMHAAAERAVEEGIDALQQLYAGLPEGLRERAWAAARDYDPASCLASTTLYLGPDHPPADTGALRRITAPTLVVPGNDPMHPAAIGATFAAEIPNATAPAPDTPPGQAVTDLCRLIFQG